MSLDTRLPEPFADLPRAITVAVANLLGPAPAGIASVIDAMLGGRVSRLVNHRVAQFLEDLREEFIRVADKENPREFLESQDFAHLVILGVQAAAKERQREKIRLFARLLAKGSLPKWSEKTAVIEEAIRSLAELSESEFVVLVAAISVHKTTATEQPKKQRTVIPDEITRALPGFPVDRIRPYLARLERLGIVMEMASYMDADGSYVATPLLTDLIELVESEGVR